MAVLSNFSGSCRAGVLAASAALCVSLPGAPAAAKATYTTFNDGWVTSINATDAVTGWRGDGEGFVRTADGTVTIFAVQGASETYAWSINDGNAIAGYYCETAGCNDPGLIHGFVRAGDGTIARFDVPDAGETFASSINNKGQITGYYQGDSGRFHGFVRTVGARIKTFDAPNASYTNAVSINDKGVITGSYYDSIGVHGFVRAVNGTITSFDVPGTDHGTGATGINIKGVVTGTYFDDNASHGFIRRSDGTMTVFALPGCYIESVGINRKGVVAGWCQDTETLKQFRGFIRRPDGTFKVFHVPGSGLHTTLTGINDAGVTTGNFGGGGFLRFP